LMRLSPHCFVSRQAGDIASCNLSEEARLSLAVDRGILWNNPSLNDPNTVGRLTET
jgi:hypothetical protein